MNRNAFIVLLIVFVLFSLNFSMAHEIDSSTSEDLCSSVDEEVLSTSTDGTVLNSSLGGDVLISSLNEEVLNSSEDEEVLSIDASQQTLEDSASSTKLEVAGNTSFDVIGDYFKVKLSDSNGNALKNIKVNFTLSGKTQTKTTDSSGIASLQLRVSDGTYKITTRFAGNSNYKASSLTTTVTMSNTRIVSAGLSNSEIQKIIDDAKPNNVILFNGTSYSDVNLVITKCLTLQTNVGTTLKSSSGPVITIKGKNASLTAIKGFNIQSGSDGIVVSDADYVKIIKNDISGKGNGIVATGTKFLNITDNNIVKNSKSGIVLGDTASTYVFNNDIKSNGGDGISIAKSTNVYIHGNALTGNSANGIHLSTTVNGDNYGEGPENVYINKNTINSNGKDGILIKNAGDNINVNSNEINYNRGNGISIAHIGNNKMQSNVIYDNMGNGIKFFDNYVMPKSQTISYNAIYGNHAREVEAKETYYQENGNRLQIGDNWYSDYNTMCPKIKSNNLKFVVKQTGANQFQATFLDSKGNIASMLPDRTLTVQTNDGQTITMTISGGVATFTTNANAGDIIKATVDYSERDNAYDADITSNSKPVNGKTPSYSYPAVPNYQLYEDIGAGNNGGTGNGDGTGEGDGGDAGKGRGASSQESSSNTGNSTYSQKTDPASNSANQVNDVSQSYDTDVFASEASASEASRGNSGTPGISQSVLKQIVFDEDEFFRITGMSFIVLLMILTICYYYRDDIKEMNSKR